MSGIEVQLLGGPHHGRWLTFHGTLPPAIDLPDEGEPVALDNPGEPRQPSRVRLARYDLGWAHQPGVGAWPIYRFRLV